MRLGIHSLSKKASDLIYVMCLACYVSDLILHITVHTHFAHVIFVLLLKHLLPIMCCIYYYDFFGVKPINNIIMHLFVCILNSVVLLSIRSALWTPLCIILFLKLARYFSTSCFPCSKGRVDAHNSCVALSLNSTKHSCCTVVYAEDFSM